MVEAVAWLPAVNDPFHDLARFYDPIMVHVDYDRWHLVAAAIAEMLPQPPAHLDAACGTGTLLRKLQREGWPSIGMDLSYAMLKAGRKRGPLRPVVAADLRAMPFSNAFDYVTCLFDSVNFLLDLDEVRRAFQQVAQALRPNGLFYFDVVTERMVLTHFADQQWTEKNGAFSTTWDTRYDRVTRTAETHIRVNRGAACVIRERVYDQADLEQALADAGLAVLGIHDAEHWTRPSRKTCRLDFVAAKGDPGLYTKPFKAVKKRVRTMFD